MRFELYDWMVRELELSGNDLIVYMIIYAYTGSEIGEYSLGHDFLADCIGASKPTVIRALRVLVSKGYITKIKKSVEDGRYNSFRTVRGIK